MAAWWQSFNPPLCNGVGSYGGFQFMLQDTGANTLSDLDRVAHQIVGAGRARKDVTGLIHQLLGKRSAGTGRPSIAKKPRR
jgi:hypothetical protein